MHTVLLKVTALFYLVGALAYLHFIFTLNERSPKLGRMLLLIGAVLHGAGVAARYFVAGSSPIPTPLEAVPPREAGPRAPALNSYWLPVHVLPPISGNAPFAVAFGAPVTAVEMGKD